MVKRQPFRLKIDEWDSKFFKVSIARLTISGHKKYASFSEKLSDLIRGARREKINHLVIKMENPAIYYERELLRLGMAVCGESVDLRLSYGRIKRRNIEPEYDIGILDPHDLMKIKNIAKDAFRRSYLYKGGFAGKSAVDRYHFEWVKNLSNDKDSRVFVAKDKGIVTGFLALKLDKAKRSGRIVLIAVDKKHRGEGIGSALMQECIRWGDGKLDSIYVKTQKENRGALSLYRKMGFKGIGSDKIFCIKI